MEPFRCLLPLLVLWSAATPVLAQRKPADKTPAAKTPYQEALERYRTCLDRLPFRHHTEGRTRLANTQEPEALRLLLEDYTKGKAYPDYARYTLATLLYENFREPEDLGALIAARQQHGKPGDTWLWVNTLLRETDLRDDKVAIGIATTAKAIHHRAAAIAALGMSRMGDIKQVIQANALEWPRAAGDRCLLLGAMTWALYENHRRIDETDYREALAIYANLLAPAAGLGPSAKLQISRHLQRILKTPAAFDTPQPWLDLLQRAGGGLPRSTGGTTAQPRFFGLETDGLRFCYVLDLSDSMCKKVEKQGPVTGPRPKKPKGALPDENDVRWDRIQTRWDLAREQVRISLLRLPEEAWFCVVWFGTDAGELNATKGLVRATRANVEKAIAELDAIPTGAPEPRIAPDGTLRGRTNLHFGLRRALSVAERGYVAEHAFVDPNVLVQGCDTVLVLSDGAPSWDEFGIEDTNYHEGKTVLDTEYGEEAPDQPRTTYFGPYHDDHWLLHDLRRMNAFRRVRIHCVGLGEASERLLGAIAEIGLGESHTFRH